MTLVSSAEANPCIFVKTSALIVLGSGKALENINILREVFIG